MASIQANRLFLLPIGLHNPDVRDTWATDMATIMDYTMTDKGKDVWQRFEQLWLGGSSERYSDKVLELSYEPEGFI